MLGIGRLKGRLPLPKPTPKLSVNPKYGFDRYWRDLRTFTLHNLVDYKLKDIGNWPLNRELPLATQYS